MLDSQTHRPPGWRGVESKDEFLVTKSQRSPKPHTKIGSEPAGSGVGKVILDAALGLFQERGFYGTSMRDIGTRSGTAVSHLYYYFPSKASVLQSLMTEIVRDLISDLDAALAAAGTSPTRRLIALVQTQVLFHCRRQAEAFVGRAELRSLELNDRAKIVELHDRVTSMFKSAIADGIRTGEFSCAYRSETANAIITMCNAVSTWYRPDGKLGPNAISKRYVELALRMVGAEAR